MNGSIFLQNLSFFSHTSSDYILRFEMKISFWRLHYSGLFSAVLEDKLPNLLEGGSSDNKANLFSSGTLRSTQKTAKPCGGRPRHLMIAHPGTWAHTQNRADDCKFTITTSFIQLLLFSQLLFRIFPVFPVSPCIAVRGITRRLKPSLNKLLKTPQEMCWWRWAGRTNMAHSLRITSARPSENLV